MSDSTPPAPADARRAALLPKLVAAFAKGGYDRTTTATLAAACGLRENQLYRLWPSKRDLFLAAIDHVRQEQLNWWAGFVERHGGPADALLDALLDEEASTRGSSGQHRITFAGLGRSDDAEVRAALRTLYRDLHRFLKELLEELGTEDAEAAAWGLIALGTLSNIAVELRLFNRDMQHRVLEGVGRSIALL